MIIIVEMLWSISKKYQVKNATQKRYKFSKTVCTVFGLLYFCTPLTISNIIWCGGLNQ